MAKRTLGVEEELLLVDPDNGKATAAAEQVVQQAEDRRADLGTEGDQPPSTGNSRRSRPRSAPRHHLRR